MEDCGPVIGMGILHDTNRVNISTPDEVGGLPEAGSGHLGRTSADKYQFVAKGLRQAAPYGTAPVARSGAPWPAVC